MLTAFAVLLVITALLAWANEKTIRIPTTVGVTLAGALAAIIMIVLDDTGLALGPRRQMAELLQTLNFTEFVLNGILSVLLFAGSLHLDAKLMLRHKASILTLATVSTAISTVLIGVASFYVFGWVGLPIPFIWAMLFGALISPTDPVAVLDLLKRTRVPKKIETLIAGESLFNDGVGVVFFLAVGAIAGLRGVHADPTPMGAFLLFLQEAGGGILLGAVLGWICYLLCRSVPGHNVDILLTLALVVGGYVLAAQLGMSGPLAMVVAGLIMSAKKDEAFHGDAHDEVMGFWGTLDEVFNVLLFAFIGLDVLLTETTGAQIAASVLLIVVALAARFVSVVLPLQLVRRREGYAAWTARLLTWGGLRGGIAISLALGLQPGPYRAQIVTVTFFIVLFTIAVQGLTVMPLVRRAVAADDELHGNSAPQPTP